MSFFFNDTATTEIYTLSLHDALPIYLGGARLAKDYGLLALASGRFKICVLLAFLVALSVQAVGQERSVRDRKSTTSELQSRQYLVCRLLFEKKNSSGGNTSSISRAFA